MRKRDEIIRIVHWPTAAREQLQGMLHTFIDQLDHDFDPPLSSRIQIDAYAQRLADNAEVLVAEDEEHGAPIGVCAFYCNDALTLEGYITYLGVIPRARHLKIGQQLVEQSLAIAWSHSMRSVALHTTPHDPRLQRFYERSGFAVDSRDSMSSPHGRLLMRVAAPANGTGRSE